MSTSFAGYRGIAWGLLLAFAIAAPATANVTVYSNIDTFQNQTVSSALQLWDDVNIVGGGRLESLTFHAFNLGSTNSGLTALISINFFDTLNNQPGGSSFGTISVDMSSSSFTPGLTPPITLSELDSLGFDLPVDANLAVGIFFPSQPQWGIPLYDPPSVGASNDSYWLGFNPAPQTVSGAVSSFGLELSVVPEPGTLACVLLLSPLLLRRRR